MSAQRSRGSYAFAAGQDALAWGVGDWSTNQNEALDAVAMFVRVSASAV
jgi:hypothetical protein